MKKILLLISVIVLFLTVNVEAQKQYKTFTDDAINADTTLYVSNFKVTKYSTQVVVFTFTHTDGTDSLAIAKIQGSNDNSAFYDLADASANLLETTTDGTSRLYVINPKDLYFRGWLSCAAADTVAITDASFIIKED